MDRPNGVRVSIYCRSDHSVGSDLSLIIQKNRREDLNNAATERPSQRMLSRWF